MFGVLLRRHSRSNTNYIYTTASTYTYYKHLGVSQTSSTKDIKAAYFGLAKKCHPDVSDKSDSKLRFQEISKAYKILSDETLRAEYDEQLGLDTEFTYMSDSFRDESSEAIFKKAFNIDFDDLFTSRFGYKAELENIRDHRIGISLREAVMGADKYFEINTYQRCVSCQGYGTMRGAPKARYQCPRCYGGGEIPSTRSNLEWMGVHKPEIKDWVLCGDCAGRGYIITEYCNRCDGIGRTNHIEWHPISIPPGVKHEQVLNCVGIDGVPMFMTVHILKTPGCKFDYDENDNVNCRITVNYSTLIQGGHVNVETITGDPVQIYIPPDTQPGTRVEVDTIHPTHVYTVQLFLPYYKRTTTKLDKLYREILETEQENITGIMMTLGENYCKTVEQNSLTKSQLFRNDVYRYTAIPIYNVSRWLLGGAYSRVKEWRYIGDLLKFVEGSRGITSYYPDDDRDVRRF